MLFLQTLVFQVMYRLHLLSIKTETSSFQKKKEGFVDWYFHSFLDWTSSWL